ncbi:uncharacterized protein [Dermacentor andersoni]|uniref:uncharacterized protein n=1 Tax=Dermacentor andersoni TaxID=34620 RepID=UPI003B3B154E
MPMQDGSQNNAHFKEVTSQCFRGLCSHEPLTSLATMQVSSATKPGRSLLKPKVCASRFSLGQVPQLPGRSVSNNARGSGSSSDAVLVESVAQWKEPQSSSSTL